jgi:protein TonB
MFQDALFLPRTDWRTQAVAIPLAALIHAVALTLLIVGPLLRVGDLPTVDVSDVIVVPALPATPLPPPKGRAVKAGAAPRLKRPAPVAGGEAWRFIPVVIPDGIVEEGFGSGGAPEGIPGGVDYGAGEGLPANLLGAGLYELVGKPEDYPVRAVGDVKPPRLIRRVEPRYPEIALHANIHGVVILEAMTDIHGRVIDVRVLRSIPLLDEAVVEAVRQWIYEPLLVNGRPRPVTFTVTVRFELTK